MMPATAEEYFNRVLRAGGRQVTLTQIQAVRETLKVLKRKTVQCEEQLKELLADLNDGILEISSEGDGEIYQNEDEDQWADPA